MCTLVFNSKREREQQAEYAWSQLQGWRVEMGETETEVEQAWTNVVKKKRERNCAHSAKVQLVATGRRPQTHHEARGQGNNSVARFQRNNSHRYDVLMALRRNVHQQCESQRLVLGTAG